MLSLDQTLLVGGCDECLTTTQMSSSDMSLFSFSTALDSLTVQSTIEMSECPGSSMGK